MHTPLRLRALTLCAFLTMVLLPAAALAVPPVFVPAPSEAGLLKPGKGTLHARFSAGFQGSFDRDFITSSPLLGSGGGEIGLTSGVRLTLDGHGGESRAGWWPDPANTTPSSSTASVVSRYFAGGRVGARIVTPTGMPEIGFGVGGGVLARHDFATDTPGAPSGGYLSPEFEIMSSGKVGANVLSVVARFGPSFEMSAGATGTDPLTVDVSLSAVADFSAAIGVGGGAFLIVGPTVVVAHDFGATTEDSKFGAAYGAVLGSVGIMGRPSPPKKK